MEKSTKELSNKFADMIGKPHIQFPKAIKTKVDFSALKRLQNRIAKDKERGLIK